MTGWHHWLDGHESEWTPGVGDGQGGLVCCDSWGPKELDMTEWLNWTELKIILENGETCVSKILLWQVLLSIQFFNMHFPVQSSIFGQFGIYFLKLNWIFYNFRNSVLADKILNSYRAHISTIDRNHNNYIVNKWMNKKNIIIK